MGASLTVQPPRLDLQVKDNYTGGNVRISIQLTEKIIWTSTTTGWCKYNATVILFYSILNSTILPLTIPICVPLRHNHSDVKRVMICMLMYVSMPIMYLRAVVSSEPTSDADQLKLKTRPGL